MKESHRLVLLVALAPILVVGGGLIYMVGMNRLEGDPRNFWDSIGFVERSDEVLVAFQEDFRFRESDVVYVCGNDEALETFQRHYC